eukprot:TRINITY_DN16721_c0_g1_i1.p1 TRINITY_DN16721_c0_g1~~TRINITY_DN16721_c0_g1_i1.p1  ORF type:complete len:344 (+),score=83.84 TRINITY_DN16721_c0_g1_i1:7-1038(+)
MTSKRPTRGGFLHLRTQWPLWAYEVVLYLLVACACWLFVLMVASFGRGHRGRNCGLEVALFILVAMCEGLLLLTRAIVLQMSVRTVKIAIVYVVVELALLPVQMATMRTEGVACISNIPTTGVMIAVHALVVLYGLHETREALHYSRVVQVVWAASGLNLINISVTSVTFMVDPDFVLIIVGMSLLNAGLDCVLTLYLVLRLWHRRIGNWARVNRGSRVRPMVSKNRDSGECSRPSQRLSGPEFKQNQRLSLPDSKPSTSSSRRGSPGIGPERGHHHVQLMIVPSSGPSCTGQQNQVAQSPHPNPLDADTAEAVSEDHGGEALTIAMALAAAGADSTAGSPSE